MDTFETRIKKMFTIFILLLALFSLPSISANTDCGGMPFSCVNSTFFKICVDFGNGVSSTVDDFVIPCPPGTECRVTNHFECEAAPMQPKANTPEEKVTTTSDAANYTKYKDERSVVTPMWEELPSVNPHEVEFSEKYLDTANTVTLADETLFTTNVVVDVITEVTTKSMFVSNPDIASFDTTTMKMVGVTERNLKGSADYVDLLKATESTTFYPGDITENSMGVSETIPTSEVISTAFSETSDVISTTEQYADKDFPQADGPEIIIDSVNLKVSNTNNNFVETTTLLNLEKSVLDYSTPSPWAEVHSTSTDEIGGLNNPISLPDVFDTTVQNQNIDLLFTTEANDVHSITLSLSPTDTTKDDVKIVNTGFPNIWNADLAPIQGNIVESYPASTESSADVTFDTISTIPVEFTTDYISEISSNKIEFSEKKITQETANTNEIKNDVTPSMIVSGNVPTSTESITQAKEVTMHDTLNLVNNEKQAGGNSGLQASEMYALNKEMQSVGLAKNTPHELVSKKPTAVVNSDNVPTESNLYPWNEKHHQITIMNIEQVTVQTESITKDYTSFAKLYGENNTGVDSSKASIDQSVAADIIKREQQGLKKLNITNVAPSSRNNAQTHNLQKNEINIGETEAQQVRSDSEILAHVGDASEVSAVKNSESSYSSQLDHITNRSDGPQIEQTRLVGIDKVAPHTVIETAETQTQQIVSNTDKTTTAPQANVISPLNQDTATFIVSTSATMSQVPSPISEKDVNDNKPTASDVQGMITESLSQTKSDAIESTSQRTHVNGESLHQTIYLPGHINIARNSYGNIQADRTVNLGSNSFSQTAPLSKTTSPLTETSIGFNESTLSEVNNSYHPEEAQHIVSISDITADKRTSQLASTMTEHTVFTAPATVIIGNVYTKIESSTPGMVLENASGAVSGVPSATDPSENTSNSPTKSSSLQNTPVEAKSETASVQVRNFPVEEPKHTVNANVADDILTVHTISKTTSPSQSKLLSLAQPPSIRKDETTAEIGKQNTNINQEILQVNNGAPHPISEVASADLTHSPNVADVDDNSTKPTNVQPRPDTSIVHQASQSSVVWDPDKPAGKISVHEIGDTVADVTDISTKPTNVQPRLDTSFVYQTSQSSVVRDADKPAGKIPVNEKDVTVANVNDISTKPTNVQPHLDTSIVHQASQSSVVRDADKPTGKISVNEKDVTAAGVNDTLTKSTNVQPRLDTSIIYQTSQSSVVRDADKPTGKIPVNEKDVTVADVNDISTKPKNVQPHLDTSFVHQASQSSIVWDADKPTAKIPVNERVYTVADVNYISTKPTNVQPRPDISILNQESQSSVVRDADKPSDQIPVNESHVNDIYTKLTHVQPRPDISIPHQESQSSEKPGTELLQSAAEPSKDVGQTTNDKVVNTQQKVKELQIPKITSSVSYGETSANTKGAHPTIFRINNSQVSNTHSTGFTSESPVPQYNFDKLLITTSTTVDNLKAENTGGQIKTDSLWHSMEATVVNPISSTLSKLTTTEKVKLVAPTTTLQDIIVHQDKLVTKESEYRGNANQEVVKNPVTIAPTSTRKRTSATPTPSASIGFSCSNLTRGRYSDKDDCRKFHICIDQQGLIVGYCPDNTVFSEIKKQCTKNLSHCVRGNEFQCVSPGRYSDYLLKNVYYICVKNHNSYYRFKFQCQTGFYLNKTLVRCMPNIEDSVESVSSDDVLEKDSDQRDKRSTSTATSTATSTSTSTERIVRRTKKPKENKSTAATERNQRRNRNECEEVGKFAHPDDCRKYYVCYKTSRSQLRRRRKKCDSDEVFHKDKRKCVDAESYECDL